jgi:hypothetical protein
MTGPGDALLHIPAANDSRGLAFTRPRMAH